MIAPATVGNLLDIQNYLCSAEGQALFAKGDSAVGIPAEVEKALSNHSA
jgi:hypothetical protein